jgi:hypothetical protein
MASNAPKTLNGKIVLQVYMLDNSYKTLLIEPNATAHVSRALLVGPRSPCFSNPPRATLARARARDASLPVPAGRVPHDGREDRLL